MAKHTAYGSPHPVGSGAQGAHGAHRAPSGAAPPSATPSGTSRHGHGGYLVAFPAKLGEAPPATPRAWPVVACTVLLGLPGLVLALGGLASGMIGLLLVPAGLLLLAPGAVSAHRRARGAAAGGPYWIAFAASTAGCALLAVAAFAALVPAYLQVRESATERALEDNIAKDGQLTAAIGLTATEVDCRPVGDRADDDRRSYSCVTRLADGRNGIINVRSDSRGTWSLAPTP